MSGRQRSRVVSVGAVRGVLVLRGGRWVVDNDSEVRLLEALRGERGARARLWALAATLDAGLVGAGDLRRLNGRLSAIAAVERPEEVWRIRAPGDLLGAVAHVCVCVSEEMLSRWLGFALSARLDANLVRGLLPGPGWASWHAPHRRRWETFDRDEHWISELPKGFWSRLEAHSDERLRAVTVASDPASRPGLLEKLIDEHYGAPEVLDLVASNPRTPTRALRRVALRSRGRAQPDLRVAQNRSATAGLLRELADRYDWEVRYVAAAHPKTPVRALRRLARDDSHQVRAAVARAGLSPTAVLEALASDRNVWVRRNVASNPSTSRAVLEVLLRDRLAAVRAAAAENENTPAEMVAALARDRAIKVRSEVAARGVGTEALALLAADPKWKVRQAVAHNAQTPLEVLSLLARDTCEEVRAGVAYNTAAPPEALRALACDEFMWTRVCVAVNESVPTEVLVALARDEDRYVRGEAAENITMPQQQLKTLAADEHWQVRAGVALNLTAPAETLVLLAEDREGHVRRCVCENDDTPRRVLHSLRSDPDYGVRVAAANAVERRRKRQWVAPRPSGGNPPEHP